MAWSAAYYWTETGHRCTTSTTRVLGISAEQLRGIDQVLVVGGGKSKVTASLAALRSRLVTTLITDDTAATEMLASERS